MGWTIAVRNEKLDAEFSVTRYLGLSLTDPGADGSGATEPSGGDYARVAIAAGDWAAAANGVKATAVDVTFPAPTAAWGTLPYVTYYAAASGGSPRGYTTLPVPKVVASGGDPPEFYAGNIKFTLT